MLFNAQLLGSDFLSDEGQRILHLGDEDLQLFEVRQILDSGRDLFNNRGRKTTAEYNAALERLGRANRGSVECAMDILDKAKAAVIAEKSAEAMSIAFERLRKEIDRLAKERGTLPDEDTIATIAFTVQCAIRGASR